MSITPEVNAKTLTQLVATEIKVQMARADVRQSQLAREIGKTEQWLSVRLRGRQPIDLNDMHLIAHALGVGVHELLPPPEAAAGARIQDSTLYRPGPVRAAARTARPRDNRPGGHPDPNGFRRSSLVPRPPRGRAA